MSMFTFAPQVWQWFYDGIKNELYVNVERIQIYETLFDAKAKRNEMNQNFFTSTPFSKIKILSSFIFFLFFLFPTSFPCKWK